MSYLIGKKYIDFIKHWFRIVSVDRLDSLQQKLRHRGSDPNPELRLEGLPDLRVRTRREKSVRSSTFWTTTLQPTGMSSYYVSIDFGANKKILLLYCNHFWSEQVWKSYYYVSINFATNRYYNLFLYFNQFWSQQVCKCF
jgi:hypothetical protein